MKKIDLEKTIKHLLWLLMEHEIWQYLFSNTKGREDGGRKAQSHMELSNIFICSKLFIDMDKADRHFKKMMRIHDATSKMTSYMNKTIGFPIDDSHPDYPRLTRKFFDMFIELAEAEWKKIEKEDLEED